MGKTFPAFSAHAHPQFYVSGKRPIGVTIDDTSINFTVWKWNAIYRIFVKFCTSLHVALKCYSHHNMKLSSGINHNKWIALQQMGLNLFALSSTSAMYIMAWLANICNQYLYCSIYLLRWAKIWLFESQIRYYLWYSPGYQPNENLICDLFLLFSWKKDGDLFW